MKVWTLNKPMQGIIKNIPGPLLPPRTNRPSLNITARSYSWTTLTQKKSEKGKKTTMTTTEMTVSRKEHKPGSSGGKSVKCRRRKQGNKKRT